MTYAQGYRDALEAAAKVADPFPVGGIARGVSDYEKQAHDIRYNIAAAIRALPVPQDAAQWQPIETAPKGGGADRVDDPAWIEPPTILLLFSKGEICVGRWDWYYAEGGHGCTGDGMAWVDNVGGEQLSLYYGAPTHWMPLPAMINAKE